MKMRRLVLPTLVIAAGMVLAGAPFAPYAAGPIGTWLTQPQQPSSNQAAPIYPDTPPAARPSTWSTVNPNMTVVERVRQRMERAFPNASISVMANADKGVVTLLGLVKTEAQKKRAYEIAADTEGVTLVHDELGIIA
jgi:hypothetical protein